MTGAAPWPLYLYGGPGRGKSCAALALCDHVSWSRYVTASGLAGMVMASFGRRERFEWEDWGPLRTKEVNGAEAVTGGASLVVLDEIGVRDKVTDTHYEAVHRLLDDREGSPLILVSNHPLDRIAEIYDGRIASRCEAGVVFELAGCDRRTA